MSNRMYVPIRFVLEKKLVSLFAKVTFGNTGAPTLVKTAGTNESKGVATITRTSAGLFVITMDDHYYRVVDVGVTRIASGAPAAPLMNVVSDAINTTGRITVQFRNAAGAATDPASGEAVLLRFELSNYSGV